MLGNKYDLDGLNDIMELPSIDPTSLIEEMLKENPYEDTMENQILQELLHKFNS